MSLQLFAPFLTLLAFAQGYTVDDCPANLPRDRHLLVHGGYCYTFVPQEREFLAAEAECRSRGGHLAVIRDWDTQQFVYNTFRQTFHFSGTVWIGLTDEQTEGVHQWVDGSSVTYSNWAAGQPSGQDKDCTLMDLASNGLWRDDSCQDLDWTSTGHTFVCENLIPGATTATPQATHSAQQQYSIADCPSDLPDSTQLYVYGSSCYDFVTSHALQYNDAERECELRNGHLVTIKDFQTQQFIFKTFSQDLNYHGMVWIGMNDQRTEGQHVWTDGSPVTYTNWASGEPSGSSYDCTVMRLDQNGLWYDYGCADGHMMMMMHHGQTNQHYFVCEYPLSGEPNSPPPPTTLSPYTVADCPAGTPTSGHLHVYANNCYDFVTGHSLNFDEAEQACARNHGHLVSIHDAAAQSFVYRTFVRDFPSYTGALWIGLTDQQYEGVHAWTDGSPVTYTNWAQGEPSGSSKDCAVMNIGQGGLWADYECSRTFPMMMMSSSSGHYYVCQYPIVKATTHVATTSVHVAPSHAAHATTTTLEPILETDPTPEPTPGPTAEPTETNLQPEENTAEPTCPPLECALDCGLSGYMLNPQGCMTCQCEN